MIEVPCIECGQPVTLTQPDDHHEYAPTGKCEKCKRFYYATLTFPNGLQVQSLQIPDSIVWNMQ